MTTTSPPHTIPDDDLSLYEGIVDIEDLSEAMAYDVASKQTVENYDDLAMLGGTGDDPSVQTLPITNLMNDYTAPADNIEHFFNAQTVSPLPLDDPLVNSTETMIGGSEEASQNTMTREESKPTVQESVQDDYDQYKILPDASWPPPMYIKRNISPDERYYMEHRWNSQWSFFDKKATENKNSYHRYQWIIGVGSVAVPVLVGINPADNTARDLLYFLTVAISLSVAISAAIENIYKYGDNWRSYRQAAEELKQEKSLYDAKAGRYLSPVNRFVNFVERCEEVIAQQNGRWIQSAEKQQAQATEQVQEILDDYNESNFNTPEGFVNAFSGDASPSFRQGYAPPPTPTQSVQQVAEQPAQPIIQQPTQGVPTAPAPMTTIQNSLSANTSDNIADYDVPIEDNNISYDVADYDVPIEDNNVSYNVADYDVPTEDNSVSYDVADYDVPIEDPDAIDIG